MENNEKAIIITYGQGRKIERISINPIKNIYNITGLYELNIAEDYCKMINNIELKYSSQIFARLVSLGTLYLLHNFIPFKFSDLIIKLEDSDIQKILKEIKNDILINAIKSEDIKAKIFQNMSKEDLEVLKEKLNNIRFINTAKVKNAQQEILSIAHHLIDCGDIVSPYMTDDELLVSNQD